MSSTCAFVCAGEPAGGNPRPASALVTRIFKFRLQYIVLANDVRCFIILQYS